MSIVYPLYYAYIVECSDATYYTGKTHDVYHRLKQHNGLLSGGAKYTKIRRPVKLVYYEEFNTHKLACQRETKIIQLSRMKKKELIERIHSPSNG